MHMYPAGHAETAYSLPGLDRLARQYWPNNVQLAHRGLLGSLRDAPTHCVPGAQPPSQSNAGLSPWARTETIPHARISTKNAEFHQEVSDAFITDNATSFRCESVCAMEGCDVRKKTGITQVYKSTNNEARTAVCRMVSISYLEIRRALCDDSSSDKRNETQIKVTGCQTLSVHDFC